MIYKLGEDEDHRPHGYMVALMLKKVQENCLKSILELK